MQYHSPITPPSSSCYTCPPHSFKPKAPVFAFNTGLYELGPNEIDPLDLPCLPDDRSAKTDTPGDFTFPSQSSANIWIPFERQRYSSASYSSIQTPPLSDYTEAPSTLGSTPSPVLLRTPRSCHHDLRHLDPLLDKQRFTPAVYRKIFSEDENDVDTIVTGNETPDIREAEGGKPLCFSTSIMKPDAPRNKTSLKSSVPPFLPPLVVPRWEVAPSRQSRNAFNERRDVGGADWVDNDDVNIKSWYPGELIGDDAHAFAPQNLLRRGAICHGSTC